MKTSKTLKHHNNGKLKYSDLRMRTVAADYLSNIPLDGNNQKNELNEIEKNSGEDDDNDLADNKKASSPTKSNKYFDRIILSQFDCFLKFNKINSKLDKQTDFFNYYKQKVITENPESNRFICFLKSEFNKNYVDPKLYINDVIVSYDNSQINKQDKKSSSTSKANNAQESSTTIIPTIREQLMSDDESNYLKAHTITNSAEKSVPIINNNHQLRTSNITLSSNSSASIHLVDTQKFAQSLNSTTVKSIKLLTNKILTKSPSDLEATNELSTSHQSKQLAFTNNGQHAHQMHKAHSDLNRKYQRTISESSNESNYGINSSNKNLGSMTSSKTRLMHYKPILFNCLKRLTNEKILFSSNNSTIGVFSRLPFSRSFKPDLNESFIMAKTRHLSINKSTIAPNSFILDVFELLELDFENYLNTGSMSYSNLIDPLSSSQASKQKASKKVFEDGQTALNTVNTFEKNTEEINELNEKDDMLATNDFCKSYKKVSSYQPDYLDDPQLTELTAGKNRTCLKFASYAVSIIDYVKPLDLKKEINETFKEKFPYIQISLTKLRSIKRELNEIALETSLDQIIVAQSYIYFEKLILQVCEFYLNFKKFSNILSRNSLKGLINKANRKYLAGNALILAAKLNDVTKKEISKLIEAIINKFRFDNKKDLLAYEFGILVALEFNLMIKYESDFQSHYERLTNGNSINVSNNIGSNTTKTNSDHPNYQSTIQSQKSPAININSAKIIFND